MTGVRLKYVHAWVDKRCGGAKARYYFERRGFARVPLPGLPGSDEFMEAYRAALAGQTAPPLQIGASRTKAGSISALITAYYVLREPRLIAAFPKPIAEACRRKRFAESSSEKGQMFAGSLRRPWAAQGGVSAVG